VSQALYSLDEAAHPLPFRELQAIKGMLEAGQAQRPDLEISVSQLQM
jgi:hypothetical protein